MPLVRIDLLEGKAPTYRQKISEIIHESMVSTIGVPAKDRFQIINEHPSAHFVYDPEYLEIHRSADLIMIQIFLNEGRSVEQKKLLYKTIADSLVERLRLRREDVLITLVEVKKENWSFGNGIAQYA